MRKGQLRRWGKHGLGIAVRPFRTREFDDVKIVSGQEACWALTRTDVKRLAEYYHIDIPAGATDAETFFHYIKGACGLTDLQAINVLAKRMVLTQEEACFSEAMADVEECLELLERPDQRQVRTEIRDAEGAEVSRKDFAVEFKAMRKKAEADAKPAVEPPKKKAKGGGKGGGPPPPFPKDKFTLTHAEAATMLPTGASIWRAHKDLRWGGHMPPFKRCSAKWGVAGLSEMEALRVVLRQMWSERLLLDGEDNSKCPIAGLM